MRLKFVVGSVLLAILMMAVPNTMHAQVHVGVAIAVAPPPITSPISTRRWPACRRACRRG